MQNYLLDENFETNPTFTQKCSEDFKKLIEEDLRKKNVKDISKEHLTSLATMMFKFFMSGAFWNGFREIALSYGYKETDQITIFSEGLGDAFGVALGNFATE